MGRRHPVAVVVDDVRPIADTLRMVLRGWGFDAIAAYDGTTGLAEIAARWPDLVISDVVMPGMSGVDMARAARRLLPDCAILLISGEADTVAAQLLAEAGLQGQITLLGKPVPPQAVLEWLRRAGFEVEEPSGRKPRRQAS